jgi:hypothetical protein
MSLSARHWHCHHEETLRLPAGLGGSDFRKVQRRLGIEQRQAQQPELPMSVHSEAQAVHEPEGHGALVPGLGT